MTRAICLFVTLLCLAAAARADEDVADPISSPWHEHEVTSAYQPRPTRLRVLTPRMLTADRRYPVVYVLPVEAGDEHRYGDGLAEIVRHDLHNRHQAIFVAPTFCQLPWYADHPSDSAIRQESHLLHAVLPFVEKHYPAETQSSGRLLLGFSKSGWGAWSLLLRHPEIFARAAAWDAPLMMNQPGRYGSGAIFGSPENFAQYEVARLVRAQTAELAKANRLVLTGYGGFREDHRQMHTLLDELQITHGYRDGPEREHDWHSGWVTEAVELLLAPRP